MTKRASPVLDSAQAMKPHGIGAMRIPSTSALRSAAATTGAVGGKPNQWGGDIYEWGRSLLDVVFEL